MLPPVRAHSTSSSNKSSECETNERAVPLLSALAVLQNTKTRKNISNAHQCNQCMDMYLKNWHSPANSVDVGFNIGGKIKVYDVCNVLEIHASGHTKFFIFGSEKKKKSIKQYKCCFLSSFILSHCVIMSKNSYITNIRIILFPHKHKEIKYSSRPTKYWFLNYRPPYNQACDPSVGKTPQSVFHQGWRHLQNILNSFIFICLCTWRWRGSLKHLTIHICWLRSMIVPNRHA